MKHIPLLAALLLAPSYAWAADITNSYATGPGGGASHVPGMVQLCPSSDGSGTAIACGSGSATAPGTPGTTAQAVQGVTGGVPVPVAPTPVTYGPAAISQITTGGTPVNALTAGSIKNGCDLINPATATEPLFFSLVGTATTTLGGGTLQLAVGVAYHCPFGTTTALSVNAATAGHIFGAMSY